MPVSKNMNAVYGALLTFFFASPAQADNEDTIATCARIASVGDRILCLESALRQSSHEEDETSPTIIVPAKEKEEAAVEAVPPNSDDAVAVDENFGLKATRPREETNAVQVTVTSMRKSLTNKFVFATADGQVWLQTDQRKIRYGDVPFEAEIRPASMGSFFLRPVAGGLSIRVRREK